MSDNVDLVLSVSTNAQEAEREIKALTDSLKAANREYALAGKRVDENTKRFNEQQKEIRELRRLLRSGGLSKEEKASANKRLFDLQERHEGTSETRQKNRKLLSQAGERIKRIDNQLSESVKKRDKIYANEAREKKRKAREERIAREKKEKEEAKTREKQAKAEERAREKADRERSNAEKVKAVALSTLAASIIKTMANVSRIAAEGALSSFSRGTKLVNSARFISTGYKEVDALGKIFEYRGGNKDDSPTTLSKLDSIMMNFRRGIISGINTESLFRLNPEIGLTPLYDAINKNTDSLGFLKIIAGYARAIKDKKHREAFYNAFGISSNVASILEAPDFNLESELKKTLPFSLNPDTATNLRQGYENATTTRQKLDNLWDSIISKFPWLGYFLGASKSTFGKIGIGAAGGAGSLYLLNLLKNRFLKPPMPSLPLPPVKPLPNNLPTQNPIWKNLWGYGKDGGKWLWGHGKDGGKWLWGHSKNFAKWGWRYTKEFASATIGTALGQALLAVALANAGQYGMLKLFEWLENGIPKEELEKRNIEQLERLHNNNIPIPMGNFEIPYSGSIYNPSDSNISVSVSLKSDASGKMAGTADVFRNGVLVASQDIVQISDFVSTQILV